MGITGTTAKEAATTIQGSIASAKAAWTNLQTGLADENADSFAAPDNPVISCGTACRIRGTAAMTRGAMLSITVTTESTNSPTNASRSAFSSASPGKRAGTIADRTVDEQLFYIDPDGNSNASAATAGSIKRSSTKKQADSVLLLRSAADFLQSPVQLQGSDRLWIV